MNIFRKIFYFFFEKAINKRFLRLSPVDVWLSEKRNADFALVTVAFNNPQVLEWQLLLCKRFLHDNYLHVILDNSVSPQARALNKDICIRHGTSYISLPPNPWTGVHNSRSHGISLDWAFRHVLPRFSYRVLGLLDHDVFPVEDHTLLAEMGDRTYMGVLQERPGVWYLWPGFFFVRSDAFKLDDVSMLPTRGTDTGGNLWWKIFRHMDKKNILFLKEQECRLRKGESRQSAFYYRIGCWIHTVNASYWNACAPKEDHILCALRKETGCTNLFTVNV